MSAAPWRAGVVTLFPDCLGVVTAHGVTGRAITRGALDVRAFNPRDLATDVHRTVDDRPYGGGPGMVMRVEPLRATILAARAWVAPGARIVCLSPQGRPLHQAALREFAALPGLVLVAGRYEGIDERLHALLPTEEWSLGDYVLSGGEIGALAIIDGVARLLSGVLGDADSARQDSFGEDGLLDHPHYTRPEVVDGLSVPRVLLEGDHAAVARWRREEALRRTRQRRPDLLAAARLSPDERREVGQDGDGLCGASGLG